MTTDRTASCGTWLCALSLFTFTSGASVLDERRLNTNSHWIMDRSAIELGRYSKYRGTSNYDYVVPIVESVLATMGTMRLETASDCA